MIGRKAEEAGWWNVQDLKEKFGIKYRIIEGKKGGNKIGGKAA